MKKYTDLEMKNRELEKENEELKSKIICPACCETFDREDFMTVKKLGEVNLKYYKENATLKSQLESAVKIIKSYQAGFNTCVKDEAEQFLKSLKGE